MVINVSYDLRAPLTSMQDYLETLLHKTDSDSGRTTTLSGPVRQSRRFTYLGHELFELAKLECEEAAEL